MSIPKILVIPGVGDFYWVATKMEGFLKKIGTKKAHFVIWNINDARSQEYIAMHTFCESVEIIDHPEDKIFSQSYFHSGNDVVENVLGCDYFICPNGSLRNGVPMDEIMPDCATNWRPYLNLFEPDKLTFAEKYGAYIVARFSDVGMWAKWVPHFGPDKIVQLLYEVYDRTGMNIVLPGYRGIELHNQIKAADTRNLINFVGRQPFPEHLALILQSRGTVGYCSGNLILAVGYGIPTIMMWHTYFKNPALFKNCNDLKSLENWYFPRMVENFNISEAMQIIEGWL